MGQELRDHTGAYLGRIEDQGNGTQFIFDSGNAYAGQYDANSNSTYARDNSFVGRGNLLASLIKR